MVKPAKPRRVQRTLIVEGGGDNNSSLKAEARRAFKCLQDNAGVTSNAKVVMAGGRGTAYTMFCAKLDQADSGDKVWLLVDSESVVTTSTRWEHVSKRLGDAWTKPGGATEGHLHFMAVVMETWLLSDQTALAKVFGKDFKGNLPSWPSLEDVAKPTIYDALHKATNGRYDKGSYSFKVLAEVNPSTLSAACPSARALLEELKKP